MRGKQPGGPIQRLLPVGLNSARAGIGIVGYLLLVVAVAVLASLLVPPATADLPATVYVDRRVGDDGNDGRTPENAYENLTTALRHAPDSANVLLMGYGNDLVYAGTETGCVTLRGTAEDPFTIRRNTYTNTLYAAEVTATRKVTDRWEQVRRDGRVRTWSVPWPDPIRLPDEPEKGFLKLGAIGIVGYPEEPPAGATQVAWWSDGRLYYRDDHYDPNEFDVFVKNGSGLCISGESEHVRIVDLSVIGAVHAIRVEPGARDVRVRHIFRENVLDSDLRGDRR